MKLLKNKTVYGTIALILIPIIGFLTISYCYINNVPREDDFDSPLNTILKFKSLSLADFSHFFEFHSDHRLVFLRVETWFQYLMAGNINFKLITFFNIVLLVPIFYLLVKPLINKLKYLEASIVSLVVFVFVYDKSIFFTHISSTYPPVLLFVVLALYFYCFSRYNLLIKTSLSLFFCVLALLGYANGISAFFIFPILMLFNKQFKSIIPWGLATAAIIKIYFYGYERSAYLGQPEYFNYFLTKIKAFFFLIGSFNIIDIRINLYLGIMIFIIILVLLLDTLVRKKYQNPEIIFYWGILIFLLGTIMMISLGRVTGHDDLTHIDVNRYRFYSVFILATTFCLVVYDKSISTNFLRVTFILFATFNILSFFKNKPGMDYNNKQDLCQSYNWINNKKGLNYYMGSESDAIEKMEAFGKMNIYTQGYSNSFTSIFDLKLEEPKPITITKNEITQTFDSVSVTHKLYNIEEKSYENKYHNSSGCFVVLKSEESTYLFPTKSKPHYGRNFIKNGVGVNGEINTEFLEQGDYCVYLLTIDSFSKERHLYPTNKVINLN
jgi:hypothetical protein